MYEAFFGLRERPFDLTPNPRFLLLTPTHREALGNVEYGIALRQGITLLIGEAGTGKTTILRRVLAAPTGDGCPKRSCVYLNNPTLTRAEFMEFLADGFGLSREASSSKFCLLRQIEQTLRDGHRSGIVRALIIDEAQSLPFELLEEIRLLANIESETEKLLAIVLVGQPELATRLNEWPLRQLKQRIALRSTLMPLTLHESATYVSTRVRLAGGDPGRLFSRDAVEAIYERSRGIPRTIGVICANALLTAFAAGRPRVEADLIAHVSHDFDLVVEAPDAPAAAGPGPIPQNVRLFQRASAPSPSAGSPNLARRVSHKLWVSQ